MPEQPAQQSVFKTFTHAVVKTTTIIGGLYVVRGYMRDRLDEVRMKMETEQKACDVLRVRFLQTQEDTSYTILALLPTLSAQILQTMDVDAITRELQTRSRARNLRHQPQTLQLQAPQPQLHDEGQSHFVRISNTATGSRPPSSLSNTDGVLLSTGSMSASYPPNPYGQSHEVDDSKSDISSSSFARSHSSEVESSPAHPSDDERSVSSSYRGSVEAETSFVSSSFISDAGSVTRSWIVESSSAGGGAEASSSLERAQSPAASAISSANGHSEASSVVGEAEARMSESILSVTTNTTSMSADSESVVGNGRSKAELWNEVKMLTFTRTLTTLYSSTLLCIFTTIQLTLLARGKYVNAIRAQEKEERMRERMEAEMSVSGLLWKSFVGGGGGMGGIEKLLNALEEGGLDDDEDEDEDEEASGWGFGWGNKKSKEKSKAKSKAKNDVKSKNRQTEGGIWTGDITDEVENKYLTMSWWLLHVGWKDVGERVRRGVEEVFDGVSLKTKLAAGDLHRLVGDVRRRVEHEITFEGNEKKANFMSSLLPPTPEIIHHVLLQGGFTPSPSYDDLYRDPGQHLEFDTDFYSQSQSQSRSSKPPVTHPERKPSDTSISLESSQLTHEFNNSPAMAVSSRVGVDPNHPHPSRQIEPYFVPTPPQQQPVHLLDPPFLALIEETRGILASSDFGTVLEVCLDRATEVLFEGLEANVFGRASEDGGEDERIRLAGLLPGLARWSQLALEGLPNELVDKILNMREVSCLSAIAFARFEEQFA